MNCPDGGDGREKIVHQPIPDTDRMEVHVDVPPPLPPHTTRAPLSGGPLVIRGGYLYYDHLLLMNGTLALRPFSEVTRAR